MASIALRKINNLEKGVFGVQLQALLIGIDRRLPLALAVKRGPQS
jgi:hypothetical protein